MSATLNLDAFDYVPAPRGARERPRLEHDDRRGGGDLMSPAKLTPAQIRDRKAKRVAIVLVVVFVVALAIQGPTILKLIHKSSPPVNAASVNVAAVSSGSSSATGVSATAVSARGCRSHDGFRPAREPVQVQAQGSVLRAERHHDHDERPPARHAPGRLDARPRRRSRRRRRRPRRPPPPRGATTPPPAAATTTTALPFTVTTPATPPNAAIVMTNGRREVIPVGADFPEEAPLFKLNALGKHAGIRISVVGGSFTSGVKTIALGLGQDAHVRERVRWNPLRGQARQADHGGTRAACRRRPEPGRRRSPDDPGGRLRRPLPRPEHGHLHLQRDQRPGARARGDRLRHRPGLGARAAPLTRPARREADRGRRQAPRRASTGTIQEGQAEVAPDLLAPVRDDDRRRHERRRGARRSSSSRRTTRRSPR